MKLNKQRRKQLTKRRNFVSRPTKRKNELLRKKRPNKNVLKKKRRPKRGPRRSVLKNLLMKRRPR